jgi:aspartyl-tRNA(Asn)/glutamyl-tRNA(Gln) amidotransferase subunit A
MRNRAKFDAILNRFDALLSPTIYFTAPTLADWQNSWRDIRAFSPVYGSATFMLNWIGLPAISIPCGFVDGLPIGLQLVGQAGSEGRLLSLARSFLDQYPRAERPPLT